MKAWTVWWDEDVCTLIHAETEGKAKVGAMSSVGSDSFLEMRAKRIPGLDNLPITYQNAKDAGFQYTTDYTDDSDGQGHLAEEQFYNDCHCDICVSKGRMI